MPPALPVLIVEDDASIRDVLADVLADEGYPTLMAEHGADALTCLEQTRPCLILLDLMMPVLDGFGVRAIQRATPHLATTR
jgi:CheY-like chemotaxis protein